MLFIIISTNAAYRINTRFFIYYEAKIDIKSTCFNTLTHLLFIKAECPCLPIQTFIFNFVLMTFHGWIWNSHVAANLPFLSFPSWMLSEKLQESFHVYICSRVRDRSSSWLFHNVNSEKKKNLFFICSVSESKGRHFALKNKLKRQTKRNTT